MLQSVAFFVFDVSGVIVFKSWEWLLEEVTESLTADDAGTAGIPSVPKMAERGCAWLTLPSTTSHGGAALGLWKLIQMRMSTKVQESWPSVKKKEEAQLPSLIRKIRRAPLVPSLGCKLQRAMILGVES